MSVTEGGTIGVRHDNDGGITLTIMGSFNFGRFDEFHRAIGDKPAPRYTVDLRQTEYIDSAALGMLLLLRERVSEDPAKVVLQVGEGQPGDVLRLANFGSLFTMS